MRIERISLDEETRFFVQHYLNLSLSSPINIRNAQKSEQNRLIQSQQVDRLLNVNDYFYKLDRAGIGKNYIAT